MINVPIHQKPITINIHILNIRAPKYMKKANTDRIEGRKRQLYNKNRDSNIPLSTIDGITKHKSKKEREDFKKKKKALQTNWT